MGLAVAVGAAKLVTLVQEQAQIPHALAAVEIYRNEIAARQRNRYLLSSAFPAANWQLGLPAPDDAHWRGFGSVNLVADGRVVFVHAGSGVLDPSFKLAIFAPPDTWAPQCGGVGLGARAQQALARYCEWNRLSVDVPPPPVQPPAPTQAPQGPSETEHEQFSERYEQGKTPLIDAADHGDEAQLRKLLAAGTEVDGRDRYGSTALMYAARAGCAACVQALLDAHADIHARNTNGAGVWSWALMQPAGAPSAATPDERLHTYELLLSHGADANLDAFDPSGRALLHRAADTDDAALAAFLLAHGAALELRDAQGRTPLMHAAVADGGDEVLELLIKAGARASARDNDNRPVIELLRLEYHGPHVEHRTALLRDAMAYPSRH
ncbi:MAG TPA: ankyrin repeat domain-containing protein [Nevskiaceae bacterium]|nr:ankyrin repeat domain-containing protein [Nevskiaceae bacterium]